MPARTPTLQICICTHNPRPDVFGRVLASIGAQSSAKDLFELIIIDNGSAPPVSEARCRYSVGPEVPLRIEREPILGLAAARLRAISATTAE